MSPNQPNQIDETESLRRLRVFLDQLEGLLDDVAKNPRPAIPGRCHASMQAAWIEVQPVFVQASTQLQFSNPSIIDELNKQGLIGAQLVFKLTVFEYRHGKLLDHGTAAEGKKKKRSWWRRWLDLFKPTLKAADVVMGSLAKAVPILEPVKEYKEAVESGADLGWKAGKALEG